MHNDNNRDSNSYRDIYRYSDSDSNDGALTQMSECTDGTFFFTIANITPYVKTATRAINSVYFLTNIYGVC